VKVLYYYLIFNTYLAILNLVVEIKNSYLYKKDKLIIKEKEKYTILNGFKYIIIIDKNYEEFLNMQNLFA